jgi:hypothetical protein
LVTQQAPKYAKNVGKPQSSTEKKTMAKGLRLSRAEAAGRSQRRAGAEEGRRSSSGEEAGHQSPSEATLQHRTTNAPIIIKPSQVEKERRRKKKKGRSVSKRQRNAE